MAAEVSPAKRRRLARNQVNQYSFIRNGKLTQKCFLFVARFLDENLRVFFFSPTPTGAPPPSTRSSSEGGSSLLGGMASMIGQGMMWGTGSGIGHRAADAIMGPRTIHYEAHNNASSEGAPASGGGAPVDARTNPCAGPMELFGKCLEQNTDNVAQCQAFADLLTSCKRDQMQ